MPMQEIIMRSSGPQFGPMAVVVEDYGRTHLAKKLGKFLNWTGHQAKHFTMLDENLKWFEDKKLAQCPAEFEDICNWLSKGGPAIAVIECSSSTKEHRPQLSEMLTGRAKGCKVLFVESVCDESCDNFFSKGPFSERKLPSSSSTGSPTQSKQLNGLNLQISSIKLCGPEVLARQINGHLQSQVLSFVSSVVPGTRTIYFSRHGESENNVLGRIGGDTDLSPRGHCYARTLGREINSMEIPELRVFTSQLKRTQQTAAFIKASMESLEALNELEAGVCEGLTYEEMQEKYPTEFAWRDQDKLRYRYPWGESYVDIMARVTPVIMELERASNVLIISHQAVLRCLVGYFLGKLPDELPYLDVPLHTVMKLTTDGNDSTFELIRLPIECVDTYRHKPQNCSVLRKQEEALITVPSHYDSINFGLLEH
ncbi:6-phosphofructo-2-kinase/fructose-2,6-bisphosphatase-like isoform X2 [Neocloeon triangulifer]|uniref:6-phosphofructo-2-kinase/fructose-2, 6-bisphosphatase-like isoform X2 n=1 Tax=Neocloeon triangulifer TaxID=2078957 RepID=UPI00286F391A|nr:6-phosphofructo-2-kinase/fructose-2,6-bisphosphatase-like isoform X2 [Neocloeon triangulifer]